MYNDNTETRKYEVASEKEVRRGENVITLQCLLKSQNKQDKEILSDLARRFSSAGIFLSLAKNRFRGLDGNG